MKNNHSMPNGKTKEKSEKTGIGAKGGSTKMFGQQGADSAKSGTSSPNSGAPNNKWGIPTGAGKGHMAKQQGADPAVAGTSSPNSGAPNNKWGVSGGKGKMFGKQTASNQRPGSSSGING